MKKIASIALAGSLALTAVATAAAPAAARDGWRNGPPPHHHRHHPRGNNGGNVAAGALFGFTLGAIASQAFAPPTYYYPPQPVYYPPAPPPPVYPVYPAYADPNSAWCASQYASYNPQTNTWVDYSGVVHVCYGPY